MVVSHWSANTAVLAVVAIVVAVHARGLRGVAADARRRGEGTRRGMGWEATACYGGLLVVILALLSPLAYWSASYIWVRSLQDVLLANVAPVFLVLGAPWLAFTDEEDRADVAANIDRGRNGVTRQHDFRFRRKDGTHMWALLVANPLFDQEGNYLGALSMLTDISERKQTERALREAKERFGAAFESAPIGMALTSTEGRVRRSCGSEEWQTAQSQPMVGTPIDVPLPSTVSLAFMV